MNVNFMRLLAERLEHVGRVEVVPEECSVTIWRFSFVCLAYYDTGQSGLICLLRVSHMVMRKPL